MILKSMINSLALFYRAAPTKQQFLCCALERFLHMCVWKYVQESSQHRLNRRVERGLKHTEDFKGKMMQHYSVV